MCIIKVNLKRINPAVIQIAAKFLLAGKTVVYPTDTAYALGGLATKSSVSQKIYQLKGRSGDKPLPMIVGGWLQLKQFFQLTPAEEQLGKHFWPGPLTLLLKLKDKRLKAAFGAQVKVAVRIPQLALARQLCLAGGAPIISTSANLSGQGSKFSSRAVVRQFGRQKLQPDLILDGGRLKASAMSTIIEIQNQRLKVIRPGAIKLKQLKAYETNFAQGR